MKEQMFNNESPVQSQIDSRYPELTWEKLLPTAPKPYLTHLKHEGALYVHFGLDIRVMVWVDNNDNLLEEFQFSRNSGSGPRYAILNARNEIVFNEYINPDLVGKKRSDFVAMVKENNYIVNLMTIYVIFFDTYNAVEDKSREDKTLYNEYCNNIFPLSHSLNLSMSGRFTIKSIAVDVTVKLRLVSKRMELSGEYIINPVNHDGALSIIAGSMTLTRQYPDFDHLGAKAFLREHEDLIYHWLRDLDKESRKLDVLDEGNAI